MLEGFLGKIVLGEPSSSSCMQGCDFGLAALAPQTSPEKLPEGVVVAEPSPLLVETDREQAPPLEKLQERLPVQLRSERGAARTTNRIAQGGAEAVQNRSPEQPVLLDCGYGCQNLLDQVLLPLVGGSLEIAHKRVRIGLVGQREHDEVQADGPTLDRSVYVCKRTIAQAEAGALRQETVGFETVELEILDG